MPACEICGRSEGNERIDRFGGRLNDHVPLGAVERCGVCGRLACPDCLHEVECCFVDADDHADEPDWSPPGWCVAGRHGTMTTYRRVE